MARYLTARPIEDVPETASVSDFDELPLEQQDALLRVVDGEYVSDTPQEDLDGDIVRYTDYYRVRVAGLRASD